MRVSLNWLRKYTEINLSVEELIAKIGAQLGSVEAVTDQRGMYKDVRIVQIIEAKPHPNADRLNVYKMTDSRAQIQVVSGDRNLQVGDKVAWLAPGTIIPSTYASDSPVIMEARAMRGEMSNGMFGSGKELVFNDNHEAVLVLDTDAKPGTLLSEAYELDDVIIDIENKMFTHRPDCFGLLGIAREIAGIQQQAFHSPDWYLLEAGRVLKPTVKELPLSIRNEIPTLCPFYQAAVMSDIQIGPSPILFQSYLKRVGIRPISNVVDVTNYLMYLTGQPLHAFDYDKVAALDGEAHAAITIRKPHTGETIELLDGRTIQPHADAILICSRHKPIALGGIMGGAETEVDDCTKNIIIEAANFNMYAIRKTSMEQGIFTDAVTRFSKGQSIAQCPVALAEAIALVERYALGHLATETGIDVADPLAEVKTSVHFITERLGTALERSHIKRLLENVEMRVGAADHELRITPGFWRTDIEIPEDIVEEVGRLHGFGSLPHELPMRRTDVAGVPTIEIFKTEVRNLLAGAGNNELQTYSFVPMRLFEKTGQDIQPAYRLRNALSPELELIRTSLLPSLLDKVHPNHKAGFDQFGLFEIGKSHNKFELGKDDLPEERLGLGYLFSVEKRAIGVWQGAAFYQAKYILEYLLAGLRLHVSLQPLDSAAVDEWWIKNLSLLFESKRAALILHKHQVLGIVGEFGASVHRNFKLPDFIAGFELDLDRLHGIARPSSSYLPILRYPAIAQDICFRVKTEVPYSALETLICNHFASDTRLRASVQSVDIYERAQDTGYKQMTYRLTLQHHERTLTTDEVSAYIQELAVRAKAEYGAEKV